MTRKLALALFAAGVMLVCGSNIEAKAATAHEIKDIIVKTAVSMGVDPCVALSIAKEESNFQNHRKNPSGAVGVYQLIPSTARSLGVNPYNLDENIKGGIMYYQMMYKKFGSVDLALAAYNAGPGNVAKYKGVPPFSETKRFIQSIKNNSKLYEQDPAVIKHTAQDDKETQQKADNTNISATETKETYTVMAPLPEKSAASDDSNPIIVPEYTL